MLRPAAILTALVAAVIVAFPAGAQAQRGPAVYRVGQLIALDEAQSGTFTLACRAGDVVTDGSWRVKSVDTSAQPDGGPYDLVTGLDVLAAEAFSQRAYRFTLRNNSGGEADVRLDVTCLDRRPGRPVHVTRLWSASRTLPVGLSGPKGPRCGRGSIAIAAGFRIDAGLARPIARYPRAPSVRRLTRTFAVLQSRTRVETSGRCLRTGGLRLTFRSLSARLTPGGADDARVRCRGHGLALLGAYRLSGAWYLGQRPHDHAHDFRVQAADADGGTARLGVVCARA